MYKSGRYYGATLYGVECGLFLDYKNLTVKTLTIVLNCDIILLALTAALTVRVSVTSERNV